MKRYKTILFDLDGTLLATKRGILKCVAKAFDELHFTLPDPETLDSFMGPPLVNCFTDVCSLPLDDAMKAIVVYRRIYEKSGMFDADVYKGLPKLLTDLKDKGFHLGVATSKCLRLAPPVLEHFELLKYFEAVGASPDEKGGWTKCDSINMALEKMGIEDKSQVVLIGDRKFDAEGANDAGVDSIGVLYGYGTEEELNSCGFTYVVNTVDDLRNALILGVND